MGNLMFPYHYSPVSATCFDGKMQLKMHTRSFCCFHAKTITLHNSWIMGGIFVIWWRWCNSLQPFWIVEIVWIDIRTLVDMMHITSQSCVHLIVEFVVRCLGDVQRCVMPYRRWTRAFGSWTLSEYWVVKYVTQRDALIANEIALLGTRKEGAEFRPRVLQLNPTPTYKHETRKKEKMSKVKMVQNENTNNRKPKGLPRCKTVQAKQRGKKLLGIIMNCKDLQSITYEFSARSKIGHDGRQRISFAMCLELTECVNKMRSW